MKSIDSFYVIYLNYNFKKKFTVLRSGEIPPCIAINLLFIMHANGNRSNESINISYVS